MRKRLLTLFLLAAGISVLNAQVTNGLVAKYSFNSGNANDEVGVNNGTVSGAVLTADRFGNANKAFSFDGVDDFLDLGASATIKPTVGSISVWAKMTAFSTTGGGYNYNPIFLSKNEANINGYFEGCALYVTSNNKLLPITTDFSTTTERYYVTINAIVNNGWYHFVITYDDDSLALFVNGQLNNRIFKGFSSVFSATEPVFFAKSGNVLNNRYFNGAIDDIRIYNRVLTAAEALSLFQEVDPMTVGINENTSSLLTSIYPNPSNGTFTIALDKNYSQATLQVVDILGKVVFSTVLNQQNSTIDMSKATKGVYFVKVNTNEGTQSTTKVVVE